MDTNEVFYVGYGSVARSKHKHGRTKHWDNIVNKAGYVVEILEHGLSDEEAKVREIFWISFYKRQCDGGSLVNNLLGGDGSRGRVDSEESKRARSIKLKEIFKSHNRRGTNNPMYGKKRPDLTERNRQRKGAKGRNGKPVTEETRLKISKANKGRKRSEEMKRRLLSKRPIKKVIDTATGVIYESSKQASESMNINAKYLVNMLCGNKPNKTTLVYYEEK